MKVCWCHEETPLPVACKRNGLTVLFFGVFLSDFAFLAWGRLSVITGDRDVQMLLRLSVLTGDQDAKFIY